MVRPPESLKPLSARIADLLVEINGLQVLDRVREKIGESATGTSVAMPAYYQAHPDSSPPRIGPWRLTDGPNGPEYTREDGREEARLWADTHGFALRKQRPRRILLFGESAARGFFFDPYFTPAIALDRILNAALETPAFEVIDLARTDLLLDDLESLLLSAMTLSPDAIVIFAGNNWHFPFMQPPTAWLAAAAETLSRRRCWQDVELVLQSQLEARIDIFFDRVAASAAECGVSVVVVTPEFNLVDWSELLDYTPFADATVREAWEAARVRASQALQDRDFAVARLFAQAMMCAAGPANPHAAVIMGRCAVAEADAAEARQWLEIARDAGCSLPLTRSPRAPRVVQDRIRSNSQRHVMSLIDLPHLFRESHGLPDRRLFMDYCHLTADGIILAMQQVAAALLNSLHISAVNTRPTTGEIGPAANQRAEAHTLAAFHNAHWGQPHDIVHYHLEQAAYHHRASIEIMCCLVRTQFQDLPI